MRFPIDAEQTCTDPIDTAVDKMIGLGDGVATGDVMIYAKALSSCTCLFDLSSTIGGYVPDPLSGFCDDEISGNSSNIDAGLPIRDIDTIERHDNSFPLQWSGPLKDGGQENV